MIILDFGSATTCRNDTAEVERMIRALAFVDTNKNKVAIKWQLFKDVYYQGEKLPELDHDVYLHAKECAGRYGYDTTASVFDKASLDFLLETDPPFIKIAARPDIYPLVSSIPADMPIIISVASQHDYDHFTWISKVSHGNVEGIMCCVPDYPAVPESYVKTFNPHDLRAGISDHTEDWTLYRMYLPPLYECHFALDDSTGLDAQDFARRPESLREIL